MQLLHASYGIGATIGPVIMTVAINLLRSWRWGYALVGGLQLILCVSFFLTASLWAMQKNNSQKEKETVHLSNCNTSIMETLRQRSVWVSIFLFFVYMGVEYTLGTWTYSLLTESRGVPTSLAGFWMGGYWGIFTAGRLLVGLFAAKVREQVIVTGGLIIALLSLILLVCNVNNGLNIIAVTLTGLAIAPVMPALLSGTAVRVGIRYTANTIGIQISSMGVGAATISSISGVIAQLFSLEAIPVFLTILVAVLIPVYYLSLSGGIDKYSS
jgi:fucose permease